MVNLVSKIIYAKDKKINDSQQSETILKYLIAFKEKILSPDTLCPDVVNLSDIMDFSSAYKFSFKCESDQVLIALQVWWRQFIYYRVKSPF